jgi:tight adherence protein C
MHPLAVSLAGFGCMFCLVCILWDRAAQAGDRTAQRLSGETGKKETLPEAAARVMQDLTAKGSKLAQWLIGAAIAVAAVVILQRLAEHYGLKKPLILAGVIVASGWLVMKFMAERRRSQWIREINYGLIDVLDMWILCLDAGMSFQGALARVAQDLELARPALRQELQLTLQEMLAGCPRDEALKNLARRCEGAGEMSALVAHIIQAEKMGSSVTKTLQVCANSLRFNRYQDMRQWVLGIPVKLAFPLIFCILPCLLIIISAPALLRMYEVLSRH